MHENRYCVIMAGGTSHKLWPISRDSRPKQFLATDSRGKSFVRLTYERFASFIPKENILVVTLSKYADLVREQIPDIAEKNILLEPYSRNTAPCIAYSTYKILKRDPDAVVVNTPADHIIDDHDVFVQTVTSIMDHAAAHPVLMTLGITPTRPASSYGYIQIAGGKDPLAPGTPAKVKTFVEKPSRDLARVFCNSGEFYWNSGVFAWQAKVIKEELEKHTPEVTTLFNGWEKALDSGGEALFLAKAYGAARRFPSTTA
jgi:Mannose-1-phosphate guanylyltransferase